MLSQPSKKKGCGSVEASDWVTSTHTVELILNTLRSVFRLEDEEERKREEHYEDLNDNDDANELNDRAAEGGGVLDL